MTSTTAYDSMKRGPQRRREKGGDQNQSLDGKKKSKKGNPVQTKNKDALFFCRVSGSVVPIRGATFPQTRVAKSEEKAVHAVPLMCSPSRPPLIVTSHESLVPRKQKPCPELPLNGILIVSLYRYKMGKDGGYTNAR
jgi:hypothetical protein